MKIQVISAKFLTAEHRLLWSQIQHNNQSLASPYFCHEFISTVAMVRNDIWIGLLMESNEIVGFFPFQRSFLPIGKPVGSILSDYHGLIVSPEFDWNVKDLLEGCGLQMWTFNHLVAYQVPFQVFCQRRSKSPVIDLSNGFETYYSQQSAGSAWIQKTRRNMKKLEKEIGTLHFQAHSIDSSLLRLLMHWKSNQYIRTGGSDLFKANWIVKLLQLIHVKKSPNFSGMLSVLYAGDQVAALHFGMRSQSIWHYWFPAYNQQLKKYFPGLILLLKMVESAEDLGLKIIDLGKGGESYKKQVMNNAVPLLEGSAELPSLLLSAVMPLRPALYRAKNLTRKTIEKVTSSKTATEHLLK